jgi:7-carboxy-7-deazaguanine synthase
MPAGRPKLEPRRVPNATSVVVKELYVSLQGESSHQGKLCTFVRLTGCHLRCAWCDSEFAFKGGERLENAEVLRRVLAERAPMVEVTGGEPLLQPGVYPLMESFLDAGLVVLLETSGAIDVRLVPKAVHKIVDLKTPSSKEHDRNDLRNFESMNANDELKFVIGSREDYEWSVAMIRQHHLDARPFSLLFSSVFPSTEPGRPPGLRPTQLAEWVIDDRLPVRFQVQQHKVLWEPNARGV